jgi:hypothetical protein
LQRTTRRYIIEDRTLQLENDCLFRYYAILSGRKVPTFGGTCCLYLTGTRLRRLDKGAYIAVGIATGYGLDDWEVVRVPVGVKNYYFSMSSRPALGSTQLPIQWVPGGLSRG